ncbi:hypothetical protein J3R83DRAFT_5441 [Lanmaoa asiatica]|nr:hypothetical protein J3R83DRAFT_5441 [Lanmaoa asiatica]
MVCDTGSAPPAPAPSVIFSDPNSIPPSTPSSYLSHPPQSTVSVVSTNMMTSINQRQTADSTAGSQTKSERKRKADSVVGSQAGTTSSMKRSRPMSATAQAQASGADTLQKLVSFLGNMDPAALQPVSFAPLGLLQMQQPAPPPIPGPSRSADDDYIDQAAEALMTFNLTPSENNDLANYMSDPQNKTRVRFFLRFDAPSCHLWIQNTLVEIQTKKDYDIGQASG